MFSTIIKFGLIVLIIVAFFTIIGQLIPDQITTNIDNSIIYFVKQLNVLNFVIPMDTVFSAMNTLATFFLAISVFTIIKWIAHFFSKS